MKKGVAGVLTASKAPGWATSSTTAYCTFFAYFVSTPSMIWWPFCFDRAVATTSKLYTGKYPDRIEVRAGS